MTQNNRIFWPVTHRFFAVSPLSGREKSPFDRVSEGRANDFTPRVILSSCM